MEGNNNVFWEELIITSTERAKQKNQKPFVAWFTGLSCSGKSTLAKNLDKKLYSMGYHTYILDGDNLRHGLTKDCDFSISGRHENLRRTGEVAKLMMDAGLIVLCAFVSPYIKDREMLTQIIGPENFVEVYVSAPIEVCASRDKKGLYTKAFQDKNFLLTGVNHPYETPENPDIIVQTDKLSINESIETIYQWLIKNKFLKT
ncbi:MAG: adenylyl-sulfate kinase [Candidatus Omnitrophica bacterium]|jgi:adenylylsulfate kinase|nr:adenylyl-sulfate kinase [Candidatus Omnitrophota bacterium]